MFGLYSLFRKSKSQNIPVHNRDNILCSLSLSNVVCMNSMPLLNSYIKCKQGNFEEKEILDATRQATKAGHAEMVSALYKRWQTTVSKNNESIELIDSVYPIDLGKYLKL